MNLFKMFAALVLFMRPRVTLQEAQMENAMFDLNKAKYEATASTAMLNNMLSAKRKGAR